MSAPDPTIRLRDLAERGVGFDMNPTMMFDSMESLWQQWRGYFGQHDEAWRGQIRVILAHLERAEEASPALSAPAADDVHEARTWLEDLLSGNGFGSDYSVEEMDAWSIDLLAEFRPRGPVTDAEVIAACEAFVSIGQRGVSHRAMRAALEAAREVRP